MADSIREALSKAFADEEPVTTTPVDTTPSPVVGNTDNETPAVTPPVIGETPPTAEKPAEIAAKPAEIAPKDGAIAPVAPAIAPIPAPASWKTAEKASWDKVPPEARAAIQRRELETQRVLSTSAEARKHQEAFRTAMNPYEPLLQAYGVKNPIDALVPLMQTRAALEVGTPDQKAQLISNLVYQFGIDIQKLDGYLVNGPKAQMPIQQQAQPQFDPKSIPELAPLFQIAEQFKSAQSAKVDAAIAEVEALPHFEDLREEMADILDMAATRGRALTVKQAYDHAAAMAGFTPSPVTATPNVSEAAAIMARSRKAASSVAGAPKQGAGAKPTTIRESLLAAMEG